MRSQQITQTIKQFTLHWCTILILFSKQWTRTSVVETRLVWETSCEMGMTWGSMNYELIVYFYFWFVSPVPVVVWISTLCLQFSVQFYCSWIASFKVAILLSLDEIKSWISLEMLQCCLLWFATQKNKFI